MLPFMLPLCVALPKLPKCSATCPRRFLSRAACRRRLACTASASNRKTSCISSAQQPISSCWCIHPFSGPGSSSVASPPPLPVLQDELGLLNTLCAQRSQEGKEVSTAPPKEPSNPSSLLAELCKLRVRAASWRLAATPGLLRSLLPGASLSRLAKLLARLMVLPSRAAWATTSGSSEQLLLRCGRDVRPTGALEAPAICSTLCARRTGVAQAGRQAAAAWSSPSLLLP